MIRARSAPARLPTYPPFARMQQGRPVAREYRLKHTVEIPEGVTLDKPGIYEWAITYADGSIRRYVGKYTRQNRPMREYHANVKRILDGRPYRKAAPTGFRGVHRELAEATREERAIVLTILKTRRRRIYTAESRP